MIKKLCQLANKLDEQGEMRAADAVDSAIDMLSKHASGNMKRHPDWVEAANKALPMLDQALDMFTDKKVDPPGDLVWAVEDLRKIVNFNKGN